MEEIGEDLKISISRNTFLSPDTIICVCAGGTGVGWFEPLFYILYLIIFPLESILFIIIVYFHILVVGTKQIYKDRNIPVGYSLPKM